MEVTNTTSSTSSTNPQPSQQVKDTATPVNPINSTASEQDFAAFITKALGGDTTKEVSEEEIFSALIAQKLHQEKAEAGDFYSQKVAELSKTMAKPDGFIPMEDVAAAALRATVAAGKIDRTTAEKINGEAFAQAQIDDVKDALYDSRGGPNDPTVAVAKMEAALLSMKSIVEKFEKGEITAAPRDLDSPSNKAPGQMLPGAPATNAVASNGKVPSGVQNPADGAMGFLWKPVSSSDGKLAILLPATLTGSIEKVELYSALPPTEKTKLAQGRFSGTNVNEGNRSNFRFPKKGDEYGDQVFVVVTKSDGTTVTYEIDDTSKRID